MWDWLSFALKSLWPAVHDWVQQHPWFTGITAFLLAFGKKIWSKLEPKAVDFIADSVQHNVAIILAGYRKLYAKHLYYKHRTFDVKGFSTQGKFALELENVYVDLSVDAAAAQAISQDPIRLPKSAESSGDRSIFAWLQADPGKPRNFAIVGPPGSGKTTLFKHLTLLLAARKGPMKRTPVLLFLREHATAIGANPDVKLAELIEASLKDLPPPSRWFVSRIKNGKCLVMFDGLDEVADPELRRKVVRWVERQAEFPAANRFLVSSRPNGYRDNPLSGFTVLQVLPFHQQQVERFVRNWYFANELVAHQKNDRGVRMEADKGADDLLSRLRRSATLQELAVNPLLLTLIATVHRYRSQLPGRRVELFAEICDVFLGKRQQAKGLELDLTPAQKVRVLRVLAYEMMLKEVREIRAAEAAAAIESTLKLVMPNGEPSAFLCMIEDSSALLVQKEAGFYGFAHLTFQEYLASLHIKEEKLLDRLLPQVDRTWWHETARLYAAQADASPIVEKCLEPERPAMEALLLATDCEAEALELRADLRNRLQDITEKAIEDPEPARRRLAAECRLERRLRDMVRLTGDRYIDRSPVTHCEYQLFIDEMRAQGEFRQPDHWDSYEFKPGTGVQPVFGLRKRDAEEFCLWLNTRKSGHWGYTLPTLDEMQCFGNDTTSCSAGYLASDGIEQIPRLAASDIFWQIEEDSGSLQVRAMQRMLWLLMYSGDLDRPRARARALALALPRARALARDLDRALDRDLALDRALDRDRDLDLPRPRPRP